MVVVVSALEQPMICDAGLAAPPTSSDARRLWGDAQWSGRGLIMQVLVDLCRIIIFNFTNSSTSKDGENNMV